MPIPGLPVLHSDTGDVCDGFFDLDIITDSPVGWRAFLFYKPVSERYKVRLLPLVGWLAAICSATSAKDWKNTTRIFEKRVIA